MLIGSQTENPVTLHRHPRSLTIRDVVNVFFRRKWIILAIALPIMIVGSLSLFGQTGSYTAASRVVVELIKVENPQWNTTGRNVDYDRELSTMFTIAMSVPVGEMAAATLVDSIPVIQELDPNLIDLHRPGRLADYLRNGLDVSIVGESAILEFRFSSPHPRISLMAVGAMREAFTEYHIYGRKNVKAVAFYEEQLSGVRTAIDSLLVARAEILNETGYSSIEDELRYESGHLANIESNLSTAVVNRRSLESEYNHLASFLDGDPRDFPMGPDENRSMTLIFWINQLAKQESDLHAMKTVHTEDSVPVQRQREMIANTLSELAAEERAYVQSIRITLESAREKEAALRDQVELIRERNSKAPDVYRRISLLDSELSSLRKLLSDLQGKLGEVRLSQFADERVSSVVVLSEPELIAVLSGSKTIVYVAVIFVFALALGIVAAFVIENLDHRVYTPSDVEDNLKLPVFASVSKVE